VRLPPERDDLHRERGPRPEGGGELPLVHHDRLPLACLGDDLLPEERPPTALDQVQVGVHLIRPVDREVEGGMLIERGDGDPELARLGLDLGRAGDAGDVPQRARAEKLSDPDQGLVGGRPVPEAEDHPRPDELHRPLCRFPLQSVVIAHGSPQDPIL